MKKEMKWDDFYPLSIHHISKIVCVCLLHTKTMVTSWEMLYPCSINFDEFLMKFSFPTHLLLPTKILKAASMMNFDIRYMVMLINFHQSCFLSSHSVTADKYILLDQLRHFHFSISSCFRNIFSIKTFSQKEALMEVFEISSLSALQV